MSDSEPNTTSAFLRLSAILTDADAPFNGAALEALAELRDALFPAVAASPDRAQPPAQPVPTAAWKAYNERASAAGVVASLQDFCAGWDARAAQPAPELPLEEALKRAYYYREDGTWGGSSDDFPEWDRWHAVAKVARRAVGPSQFDRDSYVSGWNECLAAQPAQVEPLRELIEQITNLPEWRRSGYSTLKGAILNVLDAALAALPAASKPQGEGADCRGEIRGAALMKKETP